MESLLLAGRLPEIERKILHETCTYFEVTPSALTGKLRQRRLTEPRHVAFVLYKIAGRSYPEIGRRFNRDHTTVISGVKRVLNNDRLSIIMMHLVKRIWPDGAANGSSPEVGAGGDA